MLVTGLAAMGTVAVASAIWPGVASTVFVVFVAVLALALLGPTLLGARWLHAQVSARRDLLGGAPVGSGRLVGPEPVLPTLAHLRETA
jgi:hypothetical protein